MEVKLLNYRDEAKVCNVDLNHDEVFIAVVYGDEVVDYRDGESHSHDPRADKAMFDDCYGFDGAYLAYSREAGVNLFENQEWLDRRSSYAWFMREEM